MSYAHTFEDLPVGPGFEAALRAQITPDHDAACAREFDSHQMGELASLAGKGQVPSSLLTERDEARQAVQKAWREVEDLKVRLRVLEAHSKRQDEIGVQARSDFTLFEAKRVTAEDRLSALTGSYQKSEERLRKVLPADVGSHVPARYDAQIEAAIKAACVLVAAMPPDVQKVRVQLGGHVGPEARDGRARDEVLSVHVWPIG